jgi:hypothetical protein
MMQITERMKFLPDNAFMTATEVAEVLDMNASTIRGRVRRGLFPAPDYRQVGRHLVKRNMWRVSVVRELARKKSANALV